MTSLTVVANGFIIAATLRFIYICLSVSGFFPWFEGKFRDICYWCVGSWFSIIIVAPIVQITMGYSLLDAKLLFSAFIGAVIYYQLLLTDGTDNT